MVEVHRPFCKKWCFQDRSSCGLRIQLEKTTTSHYQKIATCNIFTNSQVRLKQWFLPSACRYQLGAGDFCSSGLLRCPEEEGDEENQAGDGDIEQRSSNYLCLGGFLGHLKWFSSTNSALFWGWEYKKNTVFSRTSLLLPIFWDNFDAHVGFSWLWKSWAFSMAVQG